MMHSRPLSGPWQIGEFFEDWIRELSALVERDDVERIVACFAEAGYWRDILALTWGFRTFAGHDQIRDELIIALASARPRNFRLAKGRMAPRLIRRFGQPVIEGFFDFDTNRGLGTGFARLHYDSACPAESKIWILSTTLQELAKRPEKTRANRVSGTEWSYKFAGDNWLDKRTDRGKLRDRRPDVLIVGAGQSGLAIAARLKTIGVEAIVIEANAGVGDNWRKRYHSLTLHNEVWANHLPYMSFPDNFPAFLPKDKLAGWLEYYADAMELDVYTKSRLLSATWDETAARWKVTIEEDNAGAVAFELEVPHIVMATGSLAGFPKIPDLAGLGSFRGEVVHSSAFAGGPQYAGRSAVVFGTGTSGHDIAQELHSVGASVAMVQRGPTSVVSLVPSSTLTYSIFEEGPCEDIDLIVEAIPYPVLVEAYRRLTARTTQLDEELLTRLAAAGFKVDQGEDQTGFHMKYLRRGGGYYINVGCSELIADGVISLIHDDDIDTIAPDGIMLTNKGKHETDLLIFATGYERQGDTLARQFGVEVAERVGQVWGHDDEGFMKGMWRPTGQPGLWLMGGGLVEARIWSKFLAIQIAAQLDGDLPLAKMEAVIGDARS